MTARAELNWALVAAGVIFFIFTMLYALFTPIVNYSLNYTAYMSTTSYSKDAVSTIRTIWDYSPLWFLLAFVMYLLIRAVRESREGGL